MFNVFPSEFIKVNVPVPLLYVSPETKISVVVTPVTTNPDESKPRFMTGEPFPMFLILRFGTYAVSDAVAVIFLPAKIDE